MQFDVTHEVDGRISFLDLTVIRTERGIETIWYMKEISTVRSINAASQHPNSTLLGSVRADLHRMLDLTSPPHHPEIYEHWRVRCRYNGFDEARIMMIEKEVRSQRISRPEVAGFASRNKKVAGAFVAVPYIRGASEFVGSEIRDASSGAMGAGYKPLNKVSGVLNPLKYSTEPQLRRD